MAKKDMTVLPALQRHLAAMGENIKLARLRRTFSAAQVAERAGLSPPTLRAIERGSPTASMGAYATVLACLGLEKDLLLIARDDELGRKLQDAKLTVKARAPKRKKQS
jgi:transcriptional regulator with XRE-family HTH domain